MREEETPTIPLIVVRVTVPATTVDELVGTCARWFRDHELVFVPTEAIQPTGRRVRFVFALATGEDVVTGEGVVVRMRRDSGDPRRPPGMELRYQTLDEASAAIVERLLVAQKTPPPYVSMRIDGVSDSQQVTLQREKLEPTKETPLPPPLPPPPIASAPPMASAPPIASPPPPSPVPLTAAMVKRPSARMATLAALPTPSPEEATRGWRLVALGLATAAGMLAMTLAMAMMRRAPAPAPTGIGGNGVVVGSAAPAGASRDANANAAATEPPAVAPASTGGARPSPAPPRVRSGSKPIALRVTTQPSGATVFVDGEERGASPLTVTVAGGGAHDVVAERPRWQAAHAHVDGPGRVQLVLERPPARLRVTSTPPGAAVRLDGRDVGVTPLELDAAAYEEHQLRIELDGRVWKRKIYLRPQGREVRVGDARSVDQTGAVRVAHDLGERVRP